MSRAPPGGADDLGAWVGKRGLRSARRGASHSLWKRRLSYPVWCGPAASSGPSQGHCPGHLPRARLARAMCSPRDPPDILTPRAAPCHRDKDPQERVLLSLMWGGAQIFEDLPSSPLCILAVLSPVPWNLRCGSSGPGPVWGAFPARPLIPGNTPPGGLAPARGEHENAPQFGPKFQARRLNVD